MLENIVTNPIETPRGYKNPDYGIALRGPLSQFFSALYLKPLDDAFTNMDVTYLRYQDNELLTWFINTCWDEAVMTIAASLFNRHINPGQETDLKQNRQHSAFYQQ